MKKHIANIITGSRVVLSMPLLLIPLTSAWFYALYLLCGLSDMVDGTVSRRTNSASEFGARIHLTHRMHRRNGRGDSRGIFYIFGEKT